MASLTSILQTFFDKYREEKTKKLRNFTATHFAEVWSHFDVNGNAYIESRELNNFLTEFITSAIPSGDNSHMTEEALAAAKEAFLEKYDENSDEKIEVRELARVLPVDENFLLVFRQENPAQSSVEFLRTWKRFDKDCNGFIDSKELQVFLTDVLKEKATPERLEEYTRISLQIFDRNGDGKLQLSEMSRLLPIKENFLARPLFKCAYKLKPDEIEKLFQHYDLDASGSMESLELMGFLKDLFDLMQEPYTESDLEFYKSVVLEQWDLDQNGRINKSEMMMILTQQSQIAEVESE